MKKRRYNEGSGVFDPKPQLLTNEAHDEVYYLEHVLESGGVILYPTDTVWGLGCDAENEEAVRKIYEIKKRVDSKAMIVLVDCDAKLPYYVREVPHLAWDIIALSTKPTTLILDGARNLAPNLIADDGSIGIRVTREAFSRELCFNFRKAIVSTSANISGKPTPRNFSEISEEIKNSVDYIVDYRQDDMTLAEPSSIIKLGLHGDVKVIR